MPLKGKIEKLLSLARPVILDGASGTELQKKGMPAGVCPEKWCLENPELIRSIHEDYVSAGSDLIYTCTFGANRLKLGEFGIDDVAGVNQELALLARQAAGSKALVCGDIGPTGSFVHPFGDLEFEQAVSIFRQQALALDKGGVDLFVVETMMDIQEARAALIAIKEFSKKPVIVTMTYEKNGRTLQGTDPLSSLITLQSLGAFAVGCNCSCGPQDMLELIKVMQPYAAVPLVAKPNAGMPELSDGKTIFNMSPKQFASSAKALAAGGASFIGGCCGTGPEHISQLRKAAGMIKKTRTSLGSVPASLSSAGSGIILGERKNLVLIGECINPTGKKALRQEIGSGNFSLLKKLGMEQYKAGADVLDVNLGVPGIDEKSVMQQAINLISPILPTPLSIDSPDPDTIEKALRIYPGRALINSIPGEEKKYQKLFRAASFYGAMFILLPVSAKKLPRTLEERKKNILDLARKAKKAGLSAQNMVVDVLALSLSSLASAKDILDTISWCKQSLKCLTVIGLSNISYGLPQRTWINAGFLAMARARGLDMAIADPLNPELTHIRAVMNLLDNGPQGVMDYIAKVNPSSPEIDVHSDDLYRAVLEGNGGLAREKIKQFLSAGQGPEEILHRSLIPAIMKAGALYEKREFFLPQLLACAQAMQEGMSVIQPLLKNSGRETSRRVIICTVKGDVHDIGKNIVGLMLGNHGYEVIDLGKDVSADIIVREAKKNNVQAIGLSALMTTTMPGMDHAIKSARKHGLDVPFIVGGAAVTRSFAESIGAAYAKDAVEAVRVFDSLLKAK